MQPDNNPITPSQDQATADITPTPTNPVANNQPSSSASSPTTIEPTTVTNPTPTPLPAPQPPTPPKAKNQWYKNSVISYGIVIVSALVLAFIINTFVLQSYVVVGTSMTPTLQDGNRLIVNKTPITFHKIFSGTYLPARGDIIIFNAPMKILENGQIAEQLIKRVIGLPGDRVVVKDGKITVYNSEHPKGFNPDDKPYGKALAPTAGDVDLTVPDGYVFVCGDNRVPGGSFDSRTELGPIPIKNIVGQLTLRYMPLNEVKSF